MCVCACVCVCVRWLAVPNHCTIELLLINKLIGAVKLYQSRIVQFMNATSEVCLLLHRQVTGAPAMGDGQDSMTVYTVMMLLTGPQRAFAPY